MCPYVCKYVCWYIHLCKLVGMYVGICVGMYIGMCVCIYVGMYVCMYVVMYVAMHVGMYVCVYVGMYVGMYVASMNINDRNSNSMLILLMEGRVLYSAMGISHSACSHTYIYV